jgi:hypothetical protein
MKLGGWEAMKLGGWKAGKLESFKARILEVMEVFGCLFSLQASRPPGFLAFQHKVDFNRWKA